MDHVEAEPLLDLYGDGEIDPARAREFKGHLAECAICVGSLGRFEANRTVIASALTRERAPSALRAGILNDVRDAARRERNRRPDPNSWVRYAATIVAAVVLASAATLTLTGRGAGASVTDTVFNDHVRALATHRMIDVAAFGQPAGKFWLGGGLGYAPPFKDLKQGGFPLLGRRVDYIDGQPVSVFVYGRGPRLVSLFLRPVRREEWPAHVLARRGAFNIAWWSNGSFECWAVSTAPARDLLRMRKLFLNGGEGVRL